MPKFFHVLTDSEYFNRAGSLVHTDVTGTRDVPPPPTSRIYFIASAPHIVGAFPPAPFGDPDFVGRADMNPLVYTPVIRALFRALDRWVTDGVEPPPSRYPLLADGTLTAVDKSGWPAIPGLRAAAVADDDVSTGLRTGVVEGHRDDRAAGHRQAVRRPRAGGG